MNYLIGTNKSLRAVLQETTWGNLKALKDTETLKEGCWYRITDYNCMVNSAITTIKSGNHNYDVLVFAIDNKTLLEDAYAVKHDGDTYFNNCNLAGWELKYCLDNDQAKFPWCGSDDDGGKGVVWYLKDEYGNETYYDFKNIMERRYEITAGILDSYSRLFTVNDSLLISRQNLTIDETTEWFFYTFSICEDAELTQEKILDLSVQKITDITVSEDGVKSFRNNKLLDRHFINGKTEDFNINCFLIINKTEDSLNYANFQVENNELGDSSYGNTFNCLYKDSKTKQIIIYNNKFGKLNYNNIINSSSNNNFLGLNNRGNILDESNIIIKTKNNFNKIYSSCTTLGNGNSKNYCSGTLISLDSGNYNNSIASLKNGSVTFGNNNSDNSISISGQYSVSFGNGNSSNTVKNCRFLSFGNGNSSNNITGGVYACSFKNWNQKNTISGNGLIIETGNYNRNNTMEGISTAISLGNNNYNNKFTGSGNKNISFGDSNENNILESYNEKITFGNGNSYFTIRNQNSDITIGNGNSYWSIGESSTTPAKVTGVTIGNNLTYTSSTIRSIYGVTRTQYWS